MKAWLENIIVIFDKIFVIVDAILEAETSNKRKIE